MHPSLAIASLGVAALACAPATAQSPQVQNFAPEQLKTGAEIYARNCSPCHGAPNAICPSTAAAISQCSRIAVRDSALACTIAAS